MEKKTLEFGKDHEMEQGLGLIKPFAVGDM